MITPATANRSATNTGSNAFQGFAQTSTAAAVAILGARITRRAAILTNLDGSNAVHLGGSGVLSTTGYTLAAGASITITTSAAVYVIDGGSHASISVWEEWD